MSQFLLSRLRHYGCEESLESVFADISAVGAVRQLVTVQGDADGVELVGYLAPCAAGRDMYFCHMRGYGLGVTGYGLRVLNGPIMDR